ncbi:MAG: hypothetical protein CVV44_07685 [Spirochaetae bacterium HGW-Spirochaetae-1]|jgi:hypothetical protein|nr:MAG: hypothetical protein CVV44_07685 [Spirochaetae bacterium HGW-Spirochaetae-1]
MPVEIKFILFQLVIIIPFILGSFLKRQFRNPSGVAQKIVRANLIFVEPFVVIWSIWGLALTPELLLLPLAGLILVLGGFMLGYATVAFTRLKEKSRATYLISSSLANHGFTMGGFLCYIFGGFNGLGMSSIFLVYFMPYIFAVIFPFAGFASRKEGFSLDMLKKLFINRQNMPLYATGLALTLHLFHIPRPAFAFPMDMILMVSISMYYITLGLNFTFSDIKALRPEHLFLALGKFIALPALTWGALRFIELDRDIESVIMLQSFMPAAIYSVLSSILYDLDMRLASGLFVVNTVIFLVVVLPVLFLLNGVLFF